MHKRKLEVNFYNHVNKIIFKSAFISGTFESVSIFRDALRPLYSVAHLPNHIQSSNFEEI